MVELFANSGDHDQMLHSAASVLFLHCLPVTCLRISSLQWFKEEYLALIHIYHFFGDNSYLSFQHKNKHFVFSWYS